MVEQKLTYEKLMVKHRLLREEKHWQSSAKYNLQAQVKQPLSLMLQKLKDLL